MNVISQSPSLSPEASYEAKFLVRSASATELLAWAQQALTPDPHGEGGVYRVTTLYLDTPDRAVLERRKPHDSRKYRVRRYGDEAVLHLERKTKRGGRVRKIRWTAPGAVWQPDHCGRDDAGYWFARRIAVSQLGPAAVVSYERAAFFGDGFRLTLDRDLRIAEAEGWKVALAADALPFSAGDWILEVKHGGALPAAVREWIIRLRLTPASFSKYRDGVRCLAGALVLA